jgi:hypothetical protein
MANGDELLIAAFLGGFGATVNGRDVYKYFEPEDPDDRAARVALAKLLRSKKPLRNGLRRALADLFDPLAKGEPRKLIIVSRRRGRRPKPIGQEIARELTASVAGGSLLKSAVQDAMERYGISESTVMRAWSKYGEG